MKNYLTIHIVTQPLLATNARGEGTGNVQVLQKITTAQGPLTVLSGYALKYAIRAALEDMGRDVWRRRNIHPTPAGYGYGPSKMVLMKDAVPSSWTDHVDLLGGYMLVGKNEADGKNLSRIQRAKYQVSDAISTTVFQGDLGFGQGMVAGSSDLMPFSYERHYTRYQFVVTFNLAEAQKAHRLNFVTDHIETLMELQVGGNQASHQSTLVPASLCWRWHNEPGRSGLFVGADKSQVWQPNKPLTLAPLEQQAADLGITFERGGKEVSDLSIREALDRIKAHIMAEAG